MFERRPTVTNGIAVVLVSAEWTSLLVREDPLVSFTMPTTSLGGSTVSVGSSARLAWCTVVVPVWTQGLLFLLLHPFSPPGAQAPAVSSYRHDTRTGPGPSAVIGTWAAVHVPCGVGPESAICGPLPTWILASKVAFALGRLPQSMKTLASKRPCAGP